MVANTPRIPEKERNACFSIATIFFAHSCKAENDVYSYG